MGGGTRFVSEDGSGNRPWSRSRSGGGGGLGELLFSGGLHVNSYELRMYLTARRFAWPRQVGLKNSSVRRIGCYVGGPRGWLEDAPFLGLPLSYMFVTLFEHAPCST